MSTTADQIALLMRRSVVRTARQPANVVGPLVFPMMLLAVNSGGLKAETRLPGFFVFLFISSMNIPRNLIGVTWFRDAATANPVSYLLECVRSLIIGGWDGQALALGFGIAGALAVVALTLSARALPQRLAR